MSKCVNCGAEYDGDICPNCGRGATGGGGYPWPALLVLIIAGIPGLAMGGCGACVIVMEATQGPGGGFSETALVGAGFLAAGGLLFYLALRSFIQGLRRRK